MAQDYVMLKESSRNGTIAINKIVFHSIALISLQEVQNVVPAEGYMAKPVTVKIDKNRLNVEANIKVKYGENAAVASGQVQNRIYENILFMTGYKPASVTVNVQNFEF